MREGRRQARLGDLAADEDGAIAIGPFGSRMKADVYVDEGVPVVRGQNLTANGSLTGDFVYVTQQFAESLGNARLHPGDLVFPHRGAIGRIALIPPGDFVMSTSLMRIRVNRELALPEYVRAFFTSEAGRAEVLQFASTVGTPGIGQPLTSLRQMRVPLPPIEEQGRIAAVLGALDDLSVLDERLARKCASRAQSLWRTAVASVEGKTRVGDAANVVLGGTPSRSNPEYWGGDLPWVNSGKANEFRVIDASDWITEAGAMRSSTKLMPRGTTLIAITGATLGQISRLEIPAYGNQSLVGVHSEYELVNDHLFFAIRDKVDVLLGNATGGAQQHINRSNVQDLEVISAPPADGPDWHREVRPLMDMCRELLVEAAEVRRLRNELLPLLLSGAVAPDEIDLGAA